jgi:hypothetical protein
LRDERILRIGQIAVVRATYKAVAIASLVEPPGDLALRNDRRWSRPFEPALRARCCTGGRRAALFPPPTIATAASTPKTITLALLSAGLTAIAGLPSALRGATLRASIAAVTTIAAVSTISTLAAVLTRLEITPIAEPAAPRATPFASVGAKILVGSTTPGIALACTAVRHRLDGRARLWRRGRRRRSRLDAWRLWCRRFCNRLVSAHALRTAARGTSRSRRLGIGGSVGHDGCRRRGSRTLAIGVFFCSARVC